MLVEHRFLTSLSWPEVAARLRELLRVFDLRLATTCNACKYQPTLSSLAERGARCPRCGCEIKLLFIDQDDRTGWHLLASGAAEPQLYLRLRYEAGMISLAALAQDPPQAASAHFEELLTSLASGLEQCLGEGRPVALVQHQWQAIRKDHDALRKQWRTSSQSKLIVVSTVILGIAVVLAVLILDAL